MMCPVDSPGSVSAAVIVALLSRDPTSCVRAATGQKTEVCRAGVVRALPCAPNWLAAESVFAAMAAASLSSDNARSMPFPKIRNKSREQAIHECGGTECHISLPSIRHVCPDVGAK